MPLHKPYPHIYRRGPRPVVKPYQEARKTPLGINYFATYEIFKADLKRLFEYIEPCEENYTVYSHRTFELLVRACVEVESLCKLVFSKNQVRLDQKNANMIRYSDLEGPMKLSEYEVRCYGFHHAPFKPFRSFLNPVRKERSPSWYRAYNNVKHNRVDQFNLACLENVIQAVGATYVLLVAQYGPDLRRVLEDIATGRHMLVPDIFTVQLPLKWSADEQYDFDWNELKQKYDNDSDRFDLHNIPKIK